MSTAQSPAIEVDGRSVTKREASTIDYERLVSGIKAGDHSSIERLYEVLNKGIRFLARRALGAEYADDFVHETLLIVITAIQNGKLQDPTRLLGYVRGVVKHQTASRIQHLQRERSTYTHLAVVENIGDRRRNPEQLAIAVEQSEVMRRTLEAMSPRFREILRRFYFLGQTEQKIRLEMCLTETQFRLAKSRAKARFAELCREQMGLSRKGTRRANCHFSLGLRSTG